MIPKGTRIYSKEQPNRIEILPHPQAPLFTGKDRGDVMGEVVRMVEGGRFSTGNEEIRQAFRQAGLVSLWFFLKFIAGYVGPYQDVNRKLHVDMCNFYQKVRREGGKAGAFLPRGTFKSTVFTHGANSWEILRDPEINIGLCSAIVDRAMEFLEITQRTFDSNEMVAWLYPEFVLELDKKGTVTKDEFTVPNRVRHSVHPTIKVFAVGGSTQGIHVTYLKVDDPIGDAQLDAERNPNADMRRIEHWLKSNTRTLLINPTKGQVFVVGTRYSAGDAYQFIFQSVRSVWGFPDPQEVTLTPEGEWDLYFREVEEEGELLFPERIPREFLEKLQRDDPWTLWTQYYNRTKGLGTTEFHAYEVKECWLDREREGEWVVYWREGNEVRKQFLEEMDVVQAVDPAATEKRMDAKTSRTAVVVYARSPEEKRFVLRVDAGYVGVSVFFDWIFRNTDTFPQIRTTVLEAQGPFKMLGRLLMEERIKRKRWIGITAKGSGTQDKDSRIRVALEPLLRRGQVYVTEQARKEVMRELGVFPSGLAKDVLDAWALAERATLPVKGTEAMEEEREEEEMLQTGRNPVTGY